MPIESTGLYVDGQWLSAAAGHRLQCIDPSTGKVAREIARCDAADVDRAVSAADRAFCAGPWRRMAVAQRSALLLKFADGIAAQAEELAQAETGDNGKLIAETRAQMRAAPEWFRYYAAMIRTERDAVLAIDKPGMTAFSRREPLGVVAALTPWNSPLMLLVWKLAPAMGLLVKIVEGKGGQVDVAMYDVMMSQLNYLAGAALNTGEVIERLANSSHPYVVPAQIFPTAQGWLTLFITHDKFWQTFCQEVGRPLWITDPQFATMASRRQNRESVLAAIGEVLISAPAVDWVQRLVPLGVVAAEVGTLSDALESDLARSRDMVVTLGDGSQGLRAVGSPLKFDGFTPSYGLPPLLDEHRAQVFEKVHS